MPGAGCQFAEERKERKKRETEGDLSVFYRQKSPNKNRRQRQRMKTKDESYIKIDYPTEKSHK